MKKIYFTSLFLLATLLPTLAQEVLDGQVLIENLSLVRQGDSIIVMMDVDLSKVSVKSSREVVLTPYLCDDAIDMPLPAITVMGRRKYLYSLRSKKIRKDTPYTYRVGKVDRVTYSVSVPYERWMNSAVVMLEESSCGCRSKLQTTNVVALSAALPFVPEMLYVAPAVDATKEFTVEGTAHIDFLVNKTDIQTDFSDNAYELSVIRNTIDSICGDGDITITSMSLTGYASPEGSHKHNAALAAARAEAVKGYVQELCAIDDSLLAVSSVAEDWEGVRAFVSQSELYHRDGILAIIDSDEDADKKEALLKKTYAREYQLLLRHCFPTLRRTDYRVTYTVRGYNDVDEIRQQLYTNPERVNLNEMYLLAQSYDTDSDDYAEVILTAVRRYGADETANVNAASVSLRRGDLQAAQYYLSRAGDSGEAEYVRGVYDYVAGDFNSALSHFYLSRAAGVEKAGEAIEQIRSK